MEQIFPAQPNTERIRSKNYLDLRMGHEKSINHDMVFWKLLQKDMLEFFFMILFFDS